LLISRGVGLGMLGIIRRLGRERNRVGAQGFAMECDPGIGAAKPRAGPVRQSSATPSG